MKLNKGSKTATETETCDKKKWRFLEENVTLDPESGTPKGSKGFQGLSAGLGEFSTWEKTWENPFCLSCCNCPVW